MKGFAYVGTDQPELEVIGFVAHGILDVYESGDHRSRIGDVP